MQQQQYTPPREQAGTAARFRFAFGRPESLAITLILSLLAYAAFFSIEAREEAKAGYAERLGLIAGMQARVADNYLLRLESALRGLAADVIEPRKPLDTERIFDQVSRFRQLHQDISSLLLIRADGQILLTSHSRNHADLPSLAGEPSFSEFRDELQKASSLVVGKPLFGYISGQWVVPIRLGIRNNDGRLTHILVANLPVGIPDGFPAEPLPDAVTATGMVRDDGYLLALRPGPKAADIDMAYGKPFASWLTESAGSMLAVEEWRNEDSSVAHGRSIYMLRRLQHFPLTVFVEMPEKEIVSAWWHRVRQPYVLMGLLLAGMLFLYRMSHRHRRAWTADQRRMAQLQNYEHALHELPDEVYLFDADTLQLTFANDRALENMGLQQEEMMEKSLLSLHPQLSLESFGALIEPIRRGEQEGVEYHATQTRADGSAYPVNVRLQLVELDNKEEFLAVVHDITTLERV